MALALVLLALCSAGVAGARDDEEYGGLGMPLYEYEGAREEGRRGGAGDDGEYPERDAHSLDYKYEDDQPRGRGINGRTYYASEMWPTRIPNKKSKKKTINREQDFETLDKYNNDETAENIEPDRRNYNSKSVNEDRNKKRRSGDQDPSLRTPAKFSRQKAEDPSEHPDPNDMDNPETPQQSDLAEDESFSAVRMTTRRKKRRKQRDRPQTSTDSDEVEDNSKHGRRPIRRDLRRREDERRRIREPAQDEDVEETTLSAVIRLKARKIKRRNKEPDDFENEDTTSDDDRLRRGPGPEAGAVTDGGAPGISPAVTEGPHVPPGDYDDYPMDVDTLARRRAMLERVLGGYSTAETADDTDTPPPSPQAPTYTAATSTAIAENTVVTTVTESTSTTTELPSTSTATEPARTTAVTDTTLALVSQVPEEPRELSIAEKSRLSILKKSQKKDSLKQSMMTKPPVLRHFTSSGGGGRRAWAKAMPGDKDGSTMRFELLNPPDEARDTPERLARVKRIMRERLVSRAHSLRDLTDGWDDVVCEYVDDELLRADGEPYSSAAPHAQTPAPPAFIGCAMLLVSAVC